MWPDIINTVGLTVNIFGVFIVFYFGFPQPSHKEGIALLVEEGTVMSDGRTAAEHDADVRRRRSTFLHNSRWGLGLMGAGFALQLLATWI